MEKIITIGDKEIKVSNNVAWVMEYRDQFNKDVMEAMMPIISTLIESVSAIISESGTSGEIKVEDIASAIQGRSFELTLPLTQLGLTDSVVNVFWAMAKAADENIAPPKKWIRQFDEFPLDIIVPELGEMILTGFTSSKNLTRLRGMIKGLVQNPQPTKKKTTKKS